MSRPLRDTLIALALLLPVPLHAAAPAAVTAAVMDQNLSGQNLGDQNTGDHPDTSDDGLDEETRRELALFRTVPVSLSDAMSIAERRHAGATVADVSFDGAAKDLPVYRVRTIRDDLIREHAIDARTGEIAGAEIATSLQTLSAEDRTNFAALRGVRQPLSEAVRVAEQAAAGKAISGGLISDRGKLTFVIIVVSGADLKQVLLEPPKGRRRRTN